MLNTKRKENRGGDGDLIFEAIDDENSSREKFDEKSPSTDDGCYLSIDDERTNSSISAVDDECDNILPITDGDRLFNLVIHLQSISGKHSNEQTVGMSNFHVIHRLHHRSKVDSFGHWRGAMKKACQLKDPWEDFEIDHYPEEIVTCHEFDPVKRTWHTSEVTVKIESKPFAHGSMRECFRLKKLSIFSTNQDWDRSSNYIAKRYIDDVPMARYFDDVMMQMTTKLWAAHYNQHNPPKKVDIIQMSVLEFKDRAGQPYYHLERFIDGNYINYNSNSGFVCDDTVRHTPQAFSHFTFEASCHELIVVDIQGVGDLYTDPQIHTSLGVEYGEGNLGIRGMALFFSTHECNPICERLNLTSFDLSPGERERHIQQQSSSSSKASKLPAQTICRGSEEPFNGFSKVSSLLRRLRSPSSISEDDSDGYVSETSSITAATGRIFNHSISLPQPAQLITTFSDENLPSSSSLKKTKEPLLSTTSLNSPSPDFNFKIEDLYNAQTPNSYGDTQRPSSVMLEKTEMKKFEDTSTCYEKHESILGQIHLEMCKCYQVGRFSELGSEEFDEESAFFHLEQAAELCIKEAIFILAKVYLDLPRDLLSHYRPTDQVNQISKGLNLMIRASELHETEANLYLAQLFDNGVEESFESDWKQAAEYYEKYIRIRENESDIIDEDSETNESGQTNAIHNEIPFHDRHDTVARLATLYKTGGYNLLCNYQKAGDLFNKAPEMATAAMKGRLANKYYMSAEEAYGLEPDEESEDS
ncbi:unnamed protein product [Rotaria sp. Silwood2]|nr:unnamed protein product [Rotaria sp. Silwood2]CAF2929033.1 unnamed protein product [Rotaria sp. Silwood2]CAF3321338.1 unnamed protein product [Rotaria sp. Silwood2]